MPIEKRSEKITRMRRVIGSLKKHYPDARCSLDSATPHQLLVATILSAQCTDERVNMVTPALFSRYPSVESFAEADLSELERLVYTTGFYKVKARAIRKSAQQLVANHNGRIPRSLDQLIKLSGVGRKTASVLLGAGYRVAEGIVVDTHVARISKLLQFSRQRDPVKVERDLMGIIDRSDWIAYSHLLIFHGRALCKARKPDCKACFLRKLCPSAHI